MKLAARIAIQIAQNSALPSRLSGQEITAYADDIAIYSRILAEGVLSELWRGGHITREEMKVDPWVDARTVKVE